MPQIFCILDEGGRTLVTKSSGDIGLPSFPTVGLLCSISTFSDSAGFSVQNFGTTNVKIIYKRSARHLGSVSSMRHEFHTVLSVFMFRSLRYSDIYNVHTHAGSPTISYLYWPQATSSPTRSSSRVSCKLCTTVSSCFSARRRSKSTARGAWIICGSVCGGSPS